MISNRIGLILPLKGKLYEKISSFRSFRIDESHYVSTTPWQSNASISIHNKLTIDVHSSLTKLFIMSMYAICFSIRSCTYWGCSTLQALHEHACLFYEKCDVHSVSKMPSIITIYGVDIERKYSQVIQSSLTQCYHVNKEFLVECILKENARSCVTPTGYLFCRLYLLLINKWEPCVLQNTLLQYSS